MFTGAGFVTVDMRKARTPRVAIAIVVLIALMAAFLVAEVVGATPSSAATFTETVGGDAHTWTNYTNAGGTQGPTITAFTSVQITCALTGFRVADGNTWWYQIASAPWSNLYYVSADAFYNNGQTSGPLHGTPFVDPAVPSCDSLAGGTAETAGGAANTWTNYTNAGGTQGPTVGGGATIQIACAITGFRVADGNTWWYQIASSPWSHAYYVSADAFYNNGQTSGSLHGTPFVDPAVPLCTPGGGGGGSGNETVGGDAHTWTNYTNAGGTQGPTIPAFTSVSIACKLTGFRVADGNTWWYQIASSPWNNGFYVSADAFYNNGHTSGSLIGTPYVDSAIPDCASGARPAGETAGGLANTWANYSHAGGQAGPQIQAFTTVQISCRVNGFAVANGNTWWYLVASAPWNNVYYVSADAFYNNGQTSGSLHGTPFVDTAVPVCVNNTEAPIFGTGVGSSGAHSSASVNSPTCWQADPVNCASGDYSESVTDVAIPGRGPALKLARTYNDLSATTAGLFGNGWTSMYDQHLAISTRDGSITITLADGSQLVAEPNGSGGFTLPASADSTLRLNGDGTYTLTQQATKLLNFSATGQLLLLRDLNGYQTTLTYTGSQLSAVTDSVGRVLHVNIGTNGLVSSVVDPAGRTTTYSYDGAGNLVSVLAPLSRSTTYTYDGSHHMLTMTDPRGGTVHNTYDSQGRVTAQTDPAGLTTTFVYTGDNFSALGGTTTITDPRASAEVEQYANGFLSRDTMASGTPAQAVWVYVYDSATYGITSVTDPNGNITTHTYDATGNVLTTIDPLNRTTTYTYNTLREVTSVTDPMGVTTTTTYDAAGNVLSKSIPLVGSSPAVSQTSSYAYGDGAHPGDVTATTDPNGHVTTTAYDPNGDLARSADPLGNVTTYSYDSIGRRLTIVTPKGNVTGGQPANYRTTYTYDAADDPLTTTDPLHHVVTNTYDLDQNLASSTDAAGHKTSYTYDADNRRTMTTRPDGTKLASNYDNGGNLTSQSDGAGHITTNTYDALNRQTSMTTPDGRTTSYGYDANGNRISVTDPSARVTMNTYDADNELSGVSYSDGVTPNVSYTYDKDGRRLSMADGTGTSAYAYDSLGRLTSSQNGAGAVVQYGYDLAGNVTTLNYPGTHLVGRVFDAANHLTKITDWLGHNTTFGYDPNSNLTQETYPNTVVASTNYDAADNQTNTLNHISYYPIAGFSYTRDANNLVTSSSSTYAAAETSHSYAYTPLSQLSGDGTNSYTYDAADNLTRLASSLNLHYDTADHLTSANAGYFVIKFAYDNQGNRTNATSPFGPATYSYDQASRLTGYTAGSTNATYGYNGDGLRMSKTLNGSAEPFVYDATEQAPLMLVDGNTYYVYGPNGLPLEQINGSTVLYYHHDQLGSTRLLTDANAQIVAKYTYNPYGTLASNTGSVTNPLRFAGQYTDSETSLLYLRARYYDPGVGQFLSIDPVASTTRAPYNYAGNDPLNAVDPLGQFGIVPPEVKFLAGAALVAVHAAQGIGASAAAIYDCSRALSNSAYNIQCNSASDSAYHVWTDVSSLVDFFYDGPQLYVPPELQGPTPGKSGSGRVTSAPVSRPSCSVRIQTA